LLETKRVDQPVDGPRRVLVAKRRKNIGSRTHSAILHTRERSGTTEAGSWTDFTYTKAPEIERRTRRNRREKRLSGRIRDASHLRHFSGGCMVRPALVFRVVLFVALFGSAFVAPVPAKATAVESDADVLGAERLFSAWLE